MKLSAARRRRPLSPPMMLNLTAMIDVIFLLLVFMVTTANFAADEGVLSAKLPRDTDAAAETITVPVPPLTITLRPAGATGCHVEIEGRPALNDFQQLYDQLVALQYDPARGRDAGLHKPDDSLLIVPDRHVRWQHVIDAVNAVVRAGYTDFAFAELP